MAYILEKIGNTYNLPKKYFTCDAKSDLNGISLVDVPIGSEAYCILEEESYILDSNKQWHKKKISEDATGQARPDWNQNDETAADFVKNRPFWREKIKELMFPDITKPIDVTTEDNGRGFFIATGDFDVAKRKTNCVVFDGVEYTCEPYYSEEVGSTVIGSFDFSDYPFCISSGLILTETAGNHTVLQYYYVYTIQADYAPQLVVRTLKTADRTPYLAMEDVEKIKVAFKNGVPITVHVLYGSVRFATRVNDADDNYIFASGFGPQTGNGIMRQAEFVFSVSDGSLKQYSVSYSGSIVENENTWPLMYINNKPYKITVDGSGALSATEVI